MLKHNLRSLGVAPHSDWRSVLSESVRSPSELCRLLELPPALAAEADRACDGFPLLAPRPYLARIQPGDPADPLLAQVMPRAAETVASPGYGPDPLGEAGARCGHGLLRKYQGRILMVTTGACAVHCRFCFRRHFPYRDWSGGGSSTTTPTRSSGSDWGDALVVHQTKNDRFLERWGRHSCLPRADKNVCPTCQLGLGGPLVASSQ